MPYSERPCLSRRTILRAGSLAFATSALGGRAFGQTPAAPLKIGVI